MAKLGLWLQVLAAALRSRSNKQFYDRISPIYDQVFVDHKLHAVNMANILYKSISNNRNKTRVLDIGCGTGILSRMLSESGFDVIGLDISFESLLRLQKHDPHIPVINADATLLPFTHGFCQVVVSLGVWRHFSDPQQVILELNRILTSDGFLVVGYFPPAIGGAVHPGYGVWSRILVRLYKLLTKKLGYVDRADRLLETQTVSLARKYFKQVNTVNSGNDWHLIVARGPVKYLTR
jgi:ubiquinone/menaquinone biosynthesis C-methylase UbiE